MQLEQFKLWLIQTSLLREILHNHLLLYGLLRIFIQSLTHKGNFMKLTRHAECRFQQRGFSNLILEIILQNGRSINAPGGATNLYFGKKESQKVITELKKVIKLIERAKNRSLIIHDEEIITVYNQQ